MNKALIIGRFQPYCKNHDELINYIIDNKNNYNYDELIIIIGYSELNDKYKIDIELTYNLMLKVAEYYKDKIKINIIKVYDLNNANWYGLYIDSLLPYENIVLFGDNEFTYNCFKDLSNYKIIKPALNCKTRASDFRKDLGIKNIVDYIPEFLINEDGFQIITFKLLENKIKELHKNKE